MCLCFLVTQRNVEKKNTKILREFAENPSCCDTTVWIMHANFFSKITNAIYLPCVFIHHPASPDVLPIPCFSVPILFFLPFLPIEVFPSRSALDNALSFIHDILITNSVINTLPDQCLSSIMADRCGLMLHKELAGLLRTNSNVAGVESSIAKGDRRRIPGWRPCFQRIIKQLLLFVTVTVHLSSVDC